MTENEKAATYIGWVEDGSEAPDMSKPENYMAALETCDWWSKSRPGLWYVMKNNVGVAGDNAREALALLYDADEEVCEHGLRKR